MTIDLVVLTIAKDIFIGLVLPALLFLVFLRILIWLAEDIHERVRLYVVLRRLNKPECGFIEQMPQVGAQEKEALA